MLVVYGQRKRQAFTDEALIVVLFVYPYLSSLVVVYTSTISVFRSTHLSR